MTFKTMNQEKFERKIEQYITNPSSVQTHALKNTLWKEGKIDIFYADGGNGLRILAFKNTSLTPVEITFYMSDKNHDEMYRSIEKCTKPPFAENERIPYLPECERVQPESTVNLVEECDTMSKNYFANQGLRRSDLQRLGLGEDFIVGLFQEIIQTEDHALTMTGLVPEPQKSFLVDLIGGISYEEVVRDYQQLLESSAIPQKEELFHGFSPWEVLLNDAQRQYVSKVYNGPCKIEGGSGTGKTIIGIYRALHLAKSVYTKEQNKKILFCTYSRKLSKYIEERIFALTEVKNIENNVDVQSVDAILHQICLSTLPDKKELNDTDLDKLLAELYGKYPEEAVEKLPLVNEKNPRDTKSRQDVNNEILDNIFNPGVRTLEEYISSEMYPSDSILSEEQKRTLWHYVQFIQDHLEETNQIPVSYVAREVPSLVKEGKLEDFRYHSIILDEAQDLHDVKLRAIYSLAIEIKDNFMMLYDENQKIFKHLSFKAQGIEVAGRSETVKVNCRTTEEILNYSHQYFLKMTGKELRDTVREHTLSGELPVEIPKCASKEALLEQVLIETKNYCQTQKHEYLFGVICASISDCNGVKDYIEQNSNIPCSILQGNDYPQEGKGISIIPIQGVKGLEFDTVFLYSVDRIENSERYYKSKIITEKKLTEFIACRLYMAMTRARTKLIISKGY